MIHVSNHHNVINCISESRRSPFKIEHTNSHLPKLLPEAASAECTWSSFGPWSSCSRPCGIGTQTRNRTLLRGSSDNRRRCQGGAFEIQICNRHTCGSGKRRKNKARSTKMHQSCRSFCLHVAAAFFLKCTHLLRLSLLRQAKRSYNI